MSWDIFVQELPPTARTLGDVPEDFAPGPLDSRANLIRRIKEVAPTANFSDPAWGTLDTPSFSVEFNVGDKDPVQSLTLHVRGDDAAAAFVSDLLSHLGYRALDPQSESGLFEPGKVAEASLSRWRAYRDQVTQ
jgi:hypothetical protein